MIRKTVSKSPPDNSCRQSLKSRFFKNTGKLVFFANSCFDDKFLRNLFFFRFSNALKEGRKRGCLFSAVTINNWQ